MEEDEEKSYDFTNYYRGIRMQEVINESKALNEKIKQTAEYKKYIDKMNALRDNKELYYKVKEFRIRNYDLQNREGINAYDEINNLVKEYDEILHNSLVSDFMRAERKLCRMMRQVFDGISEGLEFDYLDE